jgi:hypothetical protein
MSALNKELDPRLAKAFGVVACLTGLFILYFFFSSLAKLVPAHSDSSYLILYAEAMLSGNWGLRGWDLTTVGFYTELPFYLVGVRLMGVHPDLVRLVPAFIYAVNILLVAAVIWKFRVRDCGWMFLPILAFLVLPSNGIWPFALNGAIHMVTLMLGLCMLLILNDRLVLESRLSQAVLFVICLFGVWGDLAFAFLFFIPLAAAGFWLHRKDALSIKTFNLSVVLPAALGMLMGQVLVIGARALGFGAPVGNGIQMFAQKETIVRRAQLLADSWIDFFGVDMWGAALSVTSLAKLSLAIGFVWWAKSVFNAWKKSESGIDLFAMFMPILSAAAVLVSHHGGGGDETRFMVPAFFVSMLLLSRNLQVESHFISRKIGALAVSLAAVTVSVGFVIDNRTLLAGDGHMSQFKRAAAEISQRGLNKGFGDFWACQATRVASEGELDIIPVNLITKNRVDPHVWAADRKWFTEPNGRYVLIHGFIGYTGKQHILAGLIGKRTVVGERLPRERPHLVELAAAYWGAPTKAIKIGEMELLIWESDLAIKEADLPKFVEPRPLPIGR